MLVSGNICSVLPYADLSGLPAGFFLKCLMTGHNISKSIISFNLSYDKTFLEGEIMARIIDTETKNMVGKKVKYYRKAAKMSQQKLSDKLEVLAIYICRGSVSRIEDQTRTVTDIELWGLSQILKVPIDAFFEEACDRSGHEKGNSHE